jgi:hypothetical protein
MAIIRIKAKRFYFRKLFAVTNIERNFLRTFKKRGKKFEFRTKNYLRQDLSMRAMMVKDVYENRAAQLLVTALKDSNEPF